MCTFQPGKFKSYGSEGVNSYREENRCGRFPPVPAFMCRISRAPRVFVQRNHSPAAAVHDWDRNQYCVAWKCPFSGTVQPATRFGAFLYCDLDPFVL